MQAHLALATVYNKGRGALRLISQSLQHGWGELLKAPRMEAKQSSPQLPPHLDSIVSLWGSSLLDGQALVCAGFG